MAHDIQAASNKRKIRWRAKHKELARLAALEEKRLHREALDAARVAAGKLPLAEANREKVRKFREKQARMKDSVAECWFGPEIDIADAIRQRIAASPNLDSSTVRSFVEACARNCRAIDLNLNAFTLHHGAHIGNHKRTVFHELIEQGVPVAEAAQRCHTEVFKPDPRLSGVQQALDTCRRFDEAKEKWGNGSEILSALLGRGAPRVRSE
jgi:hypothetical protein